MAPSKSFRHKWDNEVQALLEEAIARRPKKPPEPESPSMLDKIFFWLIVQKFNAGGVRKRWIMMETKTGETKVVRLEQLDPRERARVEEQDRKRYAELAKTYSFTVGERVYLWLLVLGTIGGVIALLVWDHLLNSAGVVG